MDVLEKRALHTSLIAFISIIITCPNGYGKLKDPCLNAMMRIGEVPEMEPLVTKALKDLQEAGCIELPVSY